MVVFIGKYIILFSYKRKKKYVEKCSKHTAKESRRKTSKQIKIKWNILINIKIKIQKLEKSDQKDKLNEVMLL